MASKQQTMEIITEAFFEFVATSFQALHEYAIESSSRRLEHTVDVRPEFFDTTGAVKYYSTSASTLRRLELAKKITPVRCDVDTKKRFRRTELDQVFGVDSVSKNRRQAEAKRRAARAATRAKKQSEYQARLKRVLEQCPDPSDVGWAAVLQRVADHFDVHPTTVKNITGVIVDPRRVRDDS